MKKPKHHSDVPDIHQVNPLEPFSNEYNKIFKLLKNETVQIETISRISNPILWSKYKSQQIALAKKNGKKPSEKLFFHLTNCTSAQLIQAKGFNVNFSCMRAFGKGINLCQSFNDLLKYNEMFKDNKGRSALIICQVLIGKSHANSSNDQKIIKNTNGSFYTKPQYVHPQKGYDSMYSETPRKEVWIIPSSQRVYPSYVVILKNE